MIWPRKRRWDFSYAPQFSFEICNVENSIFRDLSKLTLYFSVLWNHCWCFRYQKIGWFINCIDDSFWRLLVGILSFWWGIIQYPIYYLSLVRDALQHANCNVIYWAVFLRLWYFFYLHDFLALLIDTKIKTLAKPIATHMWNNTNLFLTFKIFTHFLTYLINFTIKYFSSEYPVFLKSINLFFIRYFYFLDWYPTFCFIINANNF